MFRRFRNKPGGSDAPEAAPPASDAVGLDPTPIAETLAHVLRSLGELAFDLDGIDAATVGEHFEAWARHTLVGAPAPGGRRSEGDGSEREWTGLQRFVRDHRRSEQAWVGRSLSDLRQVIWVFVRSLGRAIPEDRDADHRVARQLERLREAAEGNDTAALKREALGSVDLIEQVLSHRVERQHSQLEELSTRLDRMTVELVEVREQLSRDALTTLYNRTALDDHLERVVGFGSVLGRPAIAFVIDVDHFKWVNDKYGHGTGDRVLQQVAVTLDAAFRRRGDLVARYGGDEFVAVIQDSSLDVAQRIAERALFAVRDLAVDSEDEGEPVRVSVSIGIARLERGEDARSWLDRADRALYLAKDRGRDRAVVDTENEAAEPG